MKKRFGGKNNNNDIRVMETKEIMHKETQGVTTAKKQKPSATYTLTQMSTMIEKFKELELLGIEDLKTLEEIRKRAKGKYIEQL